MADSILAVPLVAFAFVVEQLRRFPGAGHIERRAGWIAAGLMALALVALGIWMAQRSPQRVSMADLAAGHLSYMQSWIVVSGDLEAEPSFTEEFRYTLTDPNVPDAVLRVVSPVELSVGRTTISGRLLGGNAPGQVGFGWVGQLRADTELAREPDPPWITIGLAVVALIVGLGSRTSYPMFFTESTRPAVAAATNVSVAVRRNWPSRGVAVPATFTWRPGTPVELRFEDGETLRLRLHSALSGADTGELRGLSESAPTLIVRPSTGDLAIIFATRDDRDTAVAAMTADAASRLAASAAAASRPAASA